MSWGMKILLSAGALSVILVAVGWGAGLLTAQEKGKQEEAKSVVTPATAPEHPDYQALQGTWRCETRHEVTGELLSVQDLIFKGKKYATADYAIEKNGQIGERGATSSSNTFVLLPDRTQRILEKQRYDLRKLTIDVNENDPNLVEWDVYNYTLNNNTLTLSYLGHFPLKRDDSGKVVTDRSKPLVKPRIFSNDGPQIYRKLLPVSKPARSTEEYSEEEKKLLDQLVKERVEVHKLRHDAYRSGKESITSTIDSIERLLEAQLDRDAGDVQKQLEHLQEAYTKIKFVENVAEAKYKAGSSTQLDLSTAREARINIELKLLRHKKQPRGGL